MLIVSDRQRIKKALLRNMRVYDAHLEPGQFTSTLISLMKECIRRPEVQRHMSEVEYVVWANSKKTPIKVGTPAWMINQQDRNRITDIYISREAQEDITNRHLLNKQKMYDFLWRKK